MVDYPDTPQVLTEAIFTTYNGETGTATAAELQAAFVGGEAMMSRYLRTYLVQTVVTGSYDLFDNSEALYRLPVGRVQSVNGAVLLIPGCDNCSFEEFNDFGCITIANADAGILRLDKFLSRWWGAFRGCPCTNGYSGTLRLRIVYTSGFPPGKVAGSPVLLLGLVKAAQIVLDQILDPGSAEGGAGDPGVESWGSLKHWEKRTKKANQQTPFGTSAMANWIANYVKGYRAPFGRVMGK